MLVRICFTRAGVGEAPWCVLRYAWITSAAAPAVSGAALLVPPLFSTSEGWLWKFVQLGEGRAGVAGGESEVARRDEIDASPPVWVNPPELSELMLSFSQPVVAK